MSLVHVMDDRVMKQSDETAKHKVETHADDQEMIDDVENISEQQLRIELTRRALGRAHTFSRGRQNSRGCKELKSNRHGDPLEPL